MNLGDRVTTKTGALGTITRVSKCGVVIVGWDSGETGWIMSFSLELVKGGEDD